MITQQGDVRKICSMARSRAESLYFQNLVAIFRPKSGILTPKIKVEPNMANEFLKYRLSALDRAIEHLFLTSPC